MVKWLVDPLLDSLPTVPITSFQSLPLSSSWMTPWIVDTWPSWPYSFMMRGSVPMGISLRVDSPVPMSTGTSE